MVSLPPIVRRIVAALAFAVASLTALSLVTLVYSFHIDRLSPNGTVMRLFNLDAEGGIATWYQSSTLLSCAVVLAAIAACRRLVGSPFALHWGWLSGIFVYLSLDEASAIHEITIWPLRSALGAGGLLYWTWIVPAVVVLLVLAVVYSRFLAHLPRPILRLFLFAAAMYLGGAIVVEALSGLYSDRVGEDHLVYGLITSLEELLEMTGVLAFGAGLGAYVVDYAQEAPVDAPGGRHGDLREDASRIAATAP